MLDYVVICDMYKQDSDMLPDTLVAYHLTHTCNIPGIKKTGLKAKSCKATAYGDYRQSAVYLLAYKDDAYDYNVRSMLFGSNDDVSIVQVTIPRSHYQYMHDDGIFNASCECSDGSCATGIQYIGDIPTSWLTYL